MRFEPEDQEKDYSGNWRQTGILHAGIGEEDAGVIIDLWYNLCYCQNMLFITQKES